ncbi:MAG: ribbon-helix-helix protein, CopG family [Promethearchaeota archaeon]
MPIISLQVSNDLLERFEKVRIQSGFNSKSEALRDSIVNFIEKHENFDNLKGYTIMTISLVYPFKEIIINQISNLYSRFNQIIKTITDWRIAEKKIELVLSVGEIEVIKDLYKELAKLKDVICSIREIIID